MKLGLLVKYCGIFLSVSLLSLPIFGADITLTTSDLLADPTVSFNTAGRWSNGQAPSAGNNYFTSDFTLRTPTDGESHTFGGDSLTVNNTNGYPQGLLYKGTGTTGVITINNLIVNGGFISHAQGTADLFQLDGSISVAGASTIYSKQGHTNILADISGAANLTIAATDDNANAAQRIVTLMGNNTYTGNIDVLGKLTLGDTGSMSFNIGANGVNNTVSGTGVANFNGTFNFNLTGASAAPGNSWTIASVTNQTFGSTFAVDGFSQSGDFWTNGTFLFNPLSGILSVALPPVAWNVNGGGNWSTSGNWVGGVAPGSGAEVAFGTILTAENAPATINLNVPANVSRVILTGANQYIISGPNTLTLSGLAQISTGNGTHEVAAVIAGNSGLNKTGGGTLILSGNNTYAGTTSVQQGALRVRHTGAVDGPVNVSAGATFFFEGDGLGTGFNGTFTPDISGAGQVATSLNMTTETVTFNSAKTYTGQTIVNNGTLQITGAGTLGASDGTVATWTLVDGNQSTGKLALSGVSVANELLILEAREFAALEATHLTSGGTSSWGGNIKGEVGGTQYNIESTSGTLTLSGTISAPDTGVRNFVFGGTGNFNLTGRLVDTQTNEVGIEQPGPVNNLNNVSVIKRGTGTLTISTGTNVVDDFWRGTTAIEGGKLLVTAGGVLRSSLIDVRSGGIFEVGASSYSIQPGQDLVGGGEVHAQTINVYGDSLVGPGDDGPGTLRFRTPGGSGNTHIYVGSDYFDVYGPRGGLEFDLGSTTTVGGGVNDLITGVNNLTLDIRQYDDNLQSLGVDSPVKVVINPAAGTLASGTYRLLEYSGTLTRQGFGSTSDANLFSVQLQGISGPIRQSLTVSTATSGQINLVVSGSSANQTWTGSSNNQWNVNSSPNWSGTGNAFFQLDNVTFNDSATNKTVNVVENVQPGAITFNSNTGGTYTVTGSNGIRTSGTVALTGNVTVALRNNGNELSGNVSLASGTTLSAGNGTVLGNVNVANGGTLRVGPAGLEPLFQGTNFTFVDADPNSNTTLADGSPFVPGTGPTSWTARTTFGNGGTVYQADGTDATTNAPVLRTTVTGLTPNTPYVVHVNYWDADNTTWRIQAGGTPSGLVLFDSPADAVAGATDGTPTSALTYVGTQPMVTEGNRIMYGGNLGSIMTDSSGNLVLYVDDFPTTGDDRSWYDGLSYTSTLIPSGNVTGAETLTIDGNLTLGSSSILSLDLGQNGYNDLLSVTGNLAAAGTLQVVLDNDAPALSLGNSFDLLNFGSVSGSFQSLNLPSLTAGLAWDTSALLTTGILSVIGSATPGDFDNDGDVDGRDFLVWQRNPSIGNLADWQANYGSGSLVATSTSVPEPTTLLGLLATALATLAMRRR